MRYFKNNKFRSCLKQNCCKLIWEYKNMLISDNKNIDPRLFVSEFDRIVLLLNKSYRRDLFPYFCSRHTMSLECNITPTIVILFGQLIDD